MTSMSRARVARRIAAGAAYGGGGIGLAGAAAVGLVGVLVLQRVDDPWGLAREMAAAVALIVVLAVGSAYLLARRFTRPLVELTGGAERPAGRSWR